jgi:plastocyanin
MGKRARLASAAATLLLLGQVVTAAPAAASPGVTTVTADQPSAVPAGRLWSFNDFFPRTVTVRTGSDLQFINEGFHTFTVLPAGDTAKADAHANAITLDDTDDAGLNPNGTTHSELNLPAVFPTSFTCGPVPAPACDFDGSSVVSSGAPLAGPPAPFMVHVTASPGTYVFICRIHAGMTGKLKVLPAVATVPSAAQVDKQIAKQIKNDLHGAAVADAQANRDAVKQNKDGTRTLHVTAGTSSHDGKVALLEFFPRVLDAKPGDTVVFKPKSPNEPHTVTFPGDLGTEMVNLCETASGDIPFGPPDFSCPDHPGQGPDEVEWDGGNGVWNLTVPGAAGTISDSGIVAARRWTSDVGASSTDALTTWTVSLAGAAPGTYTYVCQIHDGMEASIVVH